ncbi:hypothetical protein CDL15_Pgr010661 [Punica granatum]|uniref:Uncharacterized protein n=1 Tax=Punica granatum TaxID=22663 RepID=A0A218VTB3_PUNGR|nr:hypothetical protein CDL15_Pgr010661 [Punica granatum]
MARRCHHEPANPDTPAILLLVWKADCASFADLAKKLGLQPKELDAEVPDPNHYAALQTSLETLRLLQELYAELPEPTPYVPENLLK